MSKRAKVGDTLTLALFAQKEKKKDIALSCSIYI